MTIQLSARIATRRFVGAALLTAMAAFFVGCGSTGLVNVWSDPELSGPPLKKVLVVSVRQDLAKRRLMEDRFASALEEHGVEAVASYRLWANALPDTQTVAIELRAGEYDGVIAVSKLGTRRDTTYVPGYTTTEPHQRISRWGDRYHTYYREVTVDGYVETDVVVRHRIDVWTTRDAGQLVWTGEGNVIDTTSLDEVSKEISQDVVPALVTAGLLSK